MHRVQKLSLIFGILLVFILIGGKSDGEYVDYLSSLVPDKCTGPRIRRNWADLSYTEQSQICDIFLKMKNETLPFREGSTDKSSLYDLFVETHYNGYNAGSWHGTTHFLAAHRTMLYLVENGMRYIARKYGSTIVPPITNPCSIALPYWAWDMDFDSDLKDNYSPQNNSAIFSDGKLFGPPPDRNDKIYDVTKGYFTPDKWKTTISVSADPEQFTSPSAKGFGPTLKRYFDSSVVFQNGPSQLFQIMVKYPDYQRFAAYMEAGPHSAAHIWLGFHMKTMASPNEPLFFMHHCNIERYFCMWQDCWDYEIMSPVNAGANQYSGANPNAVTIKSTTPAKIDYSSTPSKPYDVSIDTPFPFYWKSNYGSLMLPKSSWPSPRDILFVGHSDTKETGYMGMNYRYGPDPAVNLYSTFCPNNKKWRLVNQPYSETSKRADLESMQSNSTTTTDYKKNQRLLTNKLNALKTQFKLMGGKTAGWKESKILDLCAQWECENGAKLNIDTVMDWIQMNGIPPENFDRDCDKVSLKYFEKKNILAAATKDSASSNNNVKTTWVIPVASVLAALLIIVVIITVTCIVKRRKEKMLQPEYVEMPY